MKATDPEKVNNDGSISLQLYTSNINYLLNTNMPAYYVLYHRNTNSFYYESLNDFVKSIADKNTNWYKQGSHVLRFHKKLNSEVIEEIYRSTIKKGLALRKINEALALKTASLSSGDKVLMNENLEVTTDAEIRRVIEVIGLNLINEGRWREILLVHKKASGNVASTGKYNLVLGIANYYSGNLIDALSFLKAAFRLKLDLSEDLQNYLSYFQTTAKYSIGLIDEAEYQQQLQGLEKSEDVGLYIQLQKAKEDYINNLETDSESSYRKFIENVEGIIKDPKASKNIQ